jgi:hypothetical protein
MARALAGCELIAATSKDAYVNFEIFTVLVLNANAIIINLLNAIFVNF